MNKEEIDVVYSEIEKLEKEIASKKESIIKDSMEFLKTSFENKYFKEIHAGSIVYFKILKVNKVNPANQEVELLLDFIIEEPGGCFTVSVNSQLEIDVFGKLEEITEEIYLSKLKEIYPKLLHETT